MGTTKGVPSGIPGVDLKHPKPLQPQELFYFFNLANKTTNKHLISKAFTLLNDDEFEF